MEQYSARDQIVQVVNKLFIYTDNKLWEKLKEEVLAEQLLFNMSSLGGEIQTLLQTMYAKNGTKDLKDWMRLITSPEIIS